MEDAKYRASLHPRLAMILQDPPVPLRPPSTHARWTRRRLAALAADSPAQRLHMLGPAALATRELLALLLEPGRGRSRALEMAPRLLAHFDETSPGAPLRAASAASPRELADAAGMGPAAAARLAAALELGRRAVSETRPERARVHVARDVYELLRLRMRDLAHEEVRVLLLDNQNHVFREELVSWGTLDASLVHPREVFRAAIHHAAASVILVHNHPTGDPTPSPEDGEITHQVAAAGLVVGIPLLDHVIVGEGRFHSFAESDSLFEPEQLPRSRMG